MVDYVDFDMDSVINADSSYEMKRQNFLNDVIQHEGGYVNKAVDRGGETKFGISKKQYPNLDIKNLSQMQAMMIYNNDFLNNSEANYGKNPIALKMADVQINTGKSTLLMQQSLNALALQHNLPINGGMLNEDGKMGNKTRMAYKLVRDKVGDKALMNKIVNKQKNYYLSIVDSDSTQKVFLNGWMNRADYRPE